MTPTAPSPCCGIATRCFDRRYRSCGENETLPNDLLPAYAMAYLRAGMTFVRHPLGLYVTPLLDRSARLSAGTQGMPYGAPVNMTLQRPRTAGAALNREL